MRFDRKKQEQYVDLIMRLFERGLRAASLFDKRIYDDLSALGEGFTFSICIGYDGAYIKLLVANGRLEHASGDKLDADVVITYKDLSGAWPVLIGQTSIAQSFAEHRMIVRGDLTHAIALTRIIDITEAYLFPQFLLQKFKRTLPKKQALHLVIYVTMIFMRETPNISSTITDQTQPLLDDAENQQRETVA